MEFIDLKSQQARIKDKIDANIQRVLAHGGYIQGAEVREQESRLAAYTGVKHCISCEFNLPTWMQFRTAS